MPAVCSDWSELRLRRECLSQRVVLSFVDISDALELQQASRRGPPKGYVESLEQRLEAMELVPSVSAVHSICC